MKKYQTRNRILFHIILLILFKIENKNMTQLRINTGSKKIKHLANYLKGEFEVYMIDVPYL